MHPKLTIWYRVANQYNSKYTKYTPGCTINLNVRFFKFFRFLTSGDSYQTLGGHFRLSPCTVSLIVPKVCEVIWQTLADDYMAPPTEDDWKAIEKGFRNRWNFPYCCGALDGKHVALRQPANSGSFFHNYKHHFSVVLMALVDDQYRFTYVDVGNYGSNSDSGIFRHSNFGMQFLNGELNMPPRKTLPAFPEARLLPYCIVADDAFLCRPDLLKPFSTRHLKINLCSTTAWAVLDI